MAEGSGISLTETALEHHDVLSLLEAAGPLPSRALEDDLDCSLATANRYLGTLRERGLVEKDGTAYALTALGEAVLRTVETAARQVAVLETIADSPFLSNVADAPKPFDVRWLADATVIRSTTADPYRLYDRYVEVFEDASRLRALRNEGVIPPGVLDAMTPKLLDPAFDAEGIWSRASAERFMQTHPTIHELRRENPELGVYLSEDPIPIDFSLFDSCLVILSYDQRTGHPTLYVETDDESAMGWAADVFAHYRERSKTVPDVFEEFEY